MQISEQIYNDFKRGHIDSLYREGYASMKAFAARYLTDAYAMMAEDCVQDAIEKAYRTRNTFNSPQQFKAFLYTCIRNSCVSLLRKTNSRANYISLQDTSEEERLSAAIIEQETLDRILEAGNLAPTGCNNQPQRIYVLKSDEAIARIRSLSRCAFDAPVVLLVALDETADWKSPLEAGCRAGIQDVSIVADHMMLAAWNIGVGSCWVNYFKPSEVKAAFDLPRNETPILLMTLGYPADDAKPLKLHDESKDMHAIIKLL